MRIPRLHSMQHAHSTLSNELVVVPFGAPGNNKKTPTAGNWHVDYMLYFYDVFVKRSNKCSVSDFSALSILLLLSVLVPHIINGLTYSESLLASRTTRQALVGMFSLHKVENVRTERRMISSPESKSNRPRKNGMKIARLVLCSSIPLLLRQVEMTQLKMNMCIPVGQRTCSRPKGENPRRSRCASEDRLRSHCFGTTFWPWWSKVTHSRKGCCRRCQSSSIFHSSGTERNPAGIR